MVLLINSNINRYILAKYIKHNICYFKYAFKLQLRYSPQWSFISPKSLTPSLGSQNLISVFPLSPTSGINWVELGFINNCKEPQS